MLLFLVVIRMKNLVKELQIETKPPEKSGGLLF